VECYKGNDFKKLYFERKTFKIVQRLSNLHFIKYQFSLNEIKPADHFRTFQTDFLKRKVFLLILKYSSYSSDMNSIAFIIFWNFIFMLLMFLSYTSAYSFIYYY